MRRVVAARVGPRLELLVGAGLDEARRALLERLGHLVDNGTDKGRQQAEDERRQRLADVLEQALQPGNLGDHVVDGADNLVAELEDRVDLPGHLDGVEVGAHAGDDVDVAGGAGVFLLLGGGGGLQAPGLRGEAVADAGQLADQRDEVGAAGAGAAAEEAARAAARRLVGLLGVLEGHVDLVDLGLGEVVGGLAGGC